MDQKKKQIEKIIPIYIRRTKRSAACSGFRKISEGLYVTPFSGEKPADKTQD